MTHKDRPERKALLGEQSRHNSIGKSLLSFFMPAENSTQRIFSSNHNEQKFNASLINLVKNTKYTIFSFIPILVFNQFRHFMNLFFLVLAIIQLWIPVNPFFPNFLPIFIILSLSFIREFMGEWKTAKKDSEINGEIFMFS